MNKYEKLSKPYRTLNTKFLDKLLADESNTTLTEYDKIEQENIRLKESMSEEKILDFIWNWFNENDFTLQVGFHSIDHTKAPLRDLAKAIYINLTKQEG